MTQHDSSPGSLYVSQVSHKRHDEHALFFRYRIARLLLDIDRLDAAAGKCLLFSVDRWNLFGFRRRDHGPRDGSSLRNWAERILRKDGIDIDGGRILLLAIPRILGYAFNPISIWYCHDRQDRLRAVICEVRNTFGEYHHYVLRQQGDETPDQLVDRAQKAFHVSPFMAIEGGYRFRISEPADDYLLDIRYQSDDAPLLTAIENGRRTQLRDSRLLRLFLAMPLMTFKVMAAIHWQALKLWTRGATFHPHPGNSGKETTK